MSRARAAFSSGVAGGVDALVDRVAQLAREVAVQLARIAARLRRHLRREQPQHEPVLVGRPRRAVEAQERGARALLAAEAQRAVEQPAHEVLEADRHLDERPADPGRHAIDHAAAHDRLADRRVRAPARPVAEQIRDAHGQIVVGIQEPGAPGHDAVAVGVGVVGEGEVEAVAEADEARHGVRRRRVHPDLAVPVDGHEPKRRDRPSSFTTSSRKPYRSAMGAQYPTLAPPSGSTPILRRAAAERRHVDDGAEPVDVVVDVRRSGAWSARRRARSYGMRCTPRSPAARNCVGALSSIHLVTSVSAGPPDGGSYLKPPESGGLCEGVMTMPSARPALAAAVVVEDRLRDDRRRRRTVVAVDHDVDAVRGEHLERARARGLGQRVRVPPEEERPVDALRLPVETDGLGHGEDVRSR